jgi:hypothetical protein
LLGKAGGAQCEQIALEADPEVDTKHTRRHCYTYRATSQTVEPHDGVIPWAIGSNLAPKHQLSR